MFAACETRCRPLGDYDIWDTSRANFSINRMRLFFDRRRLEPEAENGFVILSPRAARDYDIIGWLPDGKCKTQNGQTAFKTLLDRNKAGRNLQSIPSTCWGNFGRYF